MLSDHFIFTSLVVIFLSVDFLLQDKTFGLKNKKGGKNQKFIAQVQKQVQSGGDPKNKKLEEQRMAEKKKKEEEKKKLEEERLLMAKPLYGSR